MDPLMMLRKFGPLLAILPFLVLVGVTGPKLYLEARGAGLFGPPKLEEGTIEYLTQESDSYGAIKCLARVRIGTSQQLSNIDCERWITLRVGDQIEQIDAWTVYLEPEEAFFHFLFDCGLAILQVIAIGFLLSIRQFLDWVQNL